jgi:ABC-type phosphate transport system substrate-binding protein
VLRLHADDVIVIVMVCVRQQNTTYGMTFLKHTYCTVAGVPWINMVNRAGKTVAPSVVSVQAAMSDFSANISAGNLTIDFVDAHGNDSWPLVFLTFLAINQSVKAIDCTNVAELLGFIAWTLTNDEYVFALLASRIVAPRRSSNACEQSVTRGLGYRSCTD